MLDSVLGRSGSGVAHFLDRLATALVRAGVTANGLSYAALALGLGGAWLFYVGRGGWALAVLLGSGLCDAVDGRVARLGGGATPWGGVIDLTFDRIVEAAVLLGIALPHPAWHQPALVLACTWYVNLCIFLAVGAASEQVKEKLIVYPPGLLERSEALFFALVVVLAPAWAPAAGYLYAALEACTGAQRVRYGRRALRG
ncbi:MAG TPA: CDP-alcohol phosphatidyltransferase family protein [Candidatus Dormibacteraeota bacterium]|nr:CDP-alcohol phosphatidyltransferase family protein [Candidatus Dormibacteraeota bacterium]